MAENFTMREVKLLEGAQEKKGHTRVVQQGQQSVDNMQMVIAHSEITQVRTCVKTVDGKMVKEEDIGEGCAQKNCLTCLARDNTSGYKSS
eukprot:685468-Heterocapsa_arctica.AAC.1